MNTWEQLKSLVKEFDEVCWSLISANGSRYSPTLEINCMYDSVNTDKFSESWHVTFQDEFFPFGTKAETMEEAVNEAYGILFDYFNQVETKEITAHYLIGDGYGKDRELRPFSVEDCRNWTRWEIDFDVFFTKKLALEQLQKEIAVKEARKTK